MTHTTERTLGELTPTRLMFGRAAHPVRCGHDHIIGDEEVHPEINFTLPSMMLDASTWRVVMDHYEKVGEMIVREAPMPDVLRL